MTKQVTSDQPVAIGKDGTVYTDADIEKMADEAEAGYDLSGWKPRTGRPVLNHDGDVPSPRIAVRVPRSLYRRVQTKAGGEHRSVSAVVRGLLESYAGRD